MAKKYIDADRLKELFDAKYKEFTEKAKKDCPLQYQYMADGLDIAEQFIDSLQQEQPEVDLEEASRNVYESWMGGAMNDVRRDMVELGKVLNARTEE